MVQAVGCAPRYARVVKASASQRGGEGRRWNMTVELLDEQRRVLDVLLVDEEGNGGCLRVTGKHGFRSEPLDALVALLKTADPDGVEVDSALWWEMWEVADVIRRKKLRGKVTVRIGVTSPKPNGGSGPIDGGQMFIAPHGAVLPPEARQYLCDRPVEVDLARWVETKAGVL